MDKNGKSSDNSKNKKSTKVEKDSTPSINSMLSSIQFEHLRTTTDKNT